MKKQKIIALDVPWMVSPSTPCLRVAVSESPSDRPAEVRFVAYFGLEETDVNSYGGTANVFYPPYETNIKLGPKQGPYQIVKVIFNDGLWVRMLPSYSDEDVVDPELFDFSALPCPIGVKQNASLWVLNFQKKWREDNRCPDPGIYEVRSSVWLNEIGARSLDFKHYLVLGHDSYVEVIARSWSWESEGS